MTDAERAEELLTKWHETDSAKAEDIAELLDAVRTETVYAAALRGAAAARDFIDENEVLDDVYDYVFQAIRGEQL